jgi:hypothetical protein
VVNLKLNFARSKESNYKQQSFKMASSVINPAPPEKRKFTEKDLYNLQMLSFLHSKREEALAKAH